MQRPSHIQPYRTYSKEVSKIYGRRIEKKIEYVDGENQFGLKEEKELDMQFGW
jgi:hypothetical protein